MIDEMVNSKMKADQPKTTSRIRYFEWYVARKEQDQMTKCTVLDNGSRR